jgi:predicted O-linked N-acetylglucosamine transferase (SPINDLY family)
VAGVYGKRRGHQRAEFGAKIDAHAERIGLASRRLLLVAPSSPVCLWVRRGHCSDICSSTAVC